MVHKQSEYRLQFHKFSNDIRTEIWRENVLLRQKLKQMNLSDHYWRYQLIDDPCECDDRGDMPSIDTDLKRTTDDETSPKLVESAASIFLDKGVQTFDWDSKMQGGYSLTEEKEECISNENHNPSLRIEHALSQEARASNIPSNLPNSRAALEHKIKTKENHQNFFIGSSSLRTATNPIKGASCSYLNPAPTRNALKSYKSVSKTTPVFAPFGWNDSDRNVGDQKTFNVRAPLDQVHQSALLASGKRFLALESHLAEQLRKRRQLNSHLSLGPINISSIWMTEYQEKFSKGQREPLAKRSLAKPVVWRYT